MANKTLGELIVRVRRICGDLVTPYYWSDDEITDLLNEACKLLSMDVQHLLKVLQFPSKTGFGEYALGDDTDEVRLVTWLQSGVQIYLEPSDDRYIRDGVRILGIPMNWYTKHMSNVTSPLGAGGAIVVTPINPEESNEYRNVLGIYPVPNIVSTVSVFYYAKHFTMRDSHDPCCIPDGWEQTIIDKAGAELSYSDDNFAKGKLLEDKWEKRKTEMSIHFARKGKTAWGRARLPDETELRQKQRRDSPTILKAQ